MINEIKRTCETCGRELETIEEHDKCFHANHDIRVQGMFSVPADSIKIS